MSYIAPGKSNGWHGCRARWLLAAAGAALVIGLIWTSVAVSQAPGAPVPSQNGAQATSDPSESFAPGWMDEVDRFFGRWLVAPLAAVIFFDFGTKHWLGTSVPFVVVWLLAGATFFTLRMKFINIRGFRHAVALTRGAYDNPHDAGEVSHFQALASALSATVGLGNIAGVAIAIATGGPGATFWMIVAGLLGMSSKFTECTLGQMYRKVAPDGTVSGGAMHYLSDGLKELGFGRLGMVLAVLFSILCIGGSLGGGNSFQIAQSLSAVRTEVALLDRHPWIYGLVMAFMVGLVIIGGIKSIGRVAEKIVPFMCGGYVLAALYIIFTHADHVIPALGRIFGEAFQPNAVYGGFLGVMVTGIKRAVFSNEAGVGSAAIAHSAARTQWPIREGMVALLEPFIDTVVICTMSALVMVITGVFERPEFAQYVKNDQGAALMKEAFVDGGHAWFRWVLYAAVVLFAYSTVISWSYYGERCWSWLFGPRTSIVYKCICLTFCVLGSVVQATNILTFSDLLILGMSFPNILGVVLLSGKVRAALDDYWARYRRGDFEADRQAALAFRRQKRKAL
ncbi:MAG: alanine glycine permease [Pirellulaceae bacterium]|nr:MAG: alanine glycine permease [Pirellulaceae bacterium]